MCRTNLIYGNSLIVCVKFASFCDVYVEVCVCFYVCVHTDVVCVQVSKYREFDTLFPKIQYVKQFAFVT